MSTIEIALQDSTGTVLRITENHLRMTVAAREGAAFLNGLHLGNLASISEEKTEHVGEPEEEPVLQERSTMLAHIIKTILLLSFLGSIFFTSHAVSWHMADSQRQDSKIKAVEELKRKGWVPPQAWVIWQHAGEGYNRINGRKQ